MAEKSRVIVVKAKGQLKVYKVKDEKFMRKKSIKMALDFLFKGEKDPKKLKLLDQIKKNLAFI
jgi:hypothetical protein